MKTSVLLMLAILTTSLTGIEKQDHDSVFPRSNDREFLLDYFQQTETNLKKSIAGLSEAQLQYKPTPDRWSVSECLEHIILTEKALFEMSKEFMEKPANPERRKEVTLKDEQLMAGITDRSHKAKATSELQGKNIYKDPKTAIKDFIKERKRVLAYIRKTSVDSMRNHIDDSPFGAIDAYQSFLFIAGHVARHTLQIEEVKASPGYPD